MFDILQADIVIMQETKIQRKDLQDDMVLVPGWDVFFSLPRHKKGTSVGIRQLWLMVFMAYEFQGTLASLYIRVTPSARPFAQRKASLAFSRPQLLRRAIVTCTRVGRLEDIHNQVNSTPQLTK